MKHYEKPEDMSLPQILEDIHDRICDEYCKWPSQYPLATDDEAYNRMGEEHCDKCPVRRLETYNGIALLDAGQYYDGAKTVDVVDTTTPTESAYGTTSIYAAKLGLDAFHGISVDGSKMLKTYLPDLSAPGAVKKGEVELIAGAVLKNSKMAGKLSGIKILDKKAA